MLLGTPYLFRLLSLSPTTQARAHALIFHCIRKYKLDTEKKQNVIENSRRQKLELLADLRPSPLLMIIFLYIVEPIKLYRSSLEFIPASHFKFVYVGLGIYIPLRG